MWRWWEEASEDRYRGIGKERKKARERKRRAVLRASRSTVKMTSQMHELERFLSRGMLICSPLVEPTAWYYERCIQFNWPKPMHFSKPEHSNAEYFTPQPSCILHWSAVSLCTREGGVSFMLYVLSCIFLSSTCFIPSHPLTLSFGRKLMNHACLPHGLTFICLLRGEVGQQQLQV